MRDNQGVCHITVIKGSNVIYFNGLWPEIKVQCQDVDIKLIISDFFYIIYITSPLLP